MINLLQSQRITLLQSHCRNVQNKPIIITLAVIFKIKILVSIQLYRLPKFSLFGYKRHQSGTAMDQAMTEPYLNGGRDKSSDQFSFAYSAYCVARASERSLVRGNED